MCKSLNAAVKIFDRIHILLDQIYKQLGDGVIALGADNKLLYALIIRKVNMCKQVDAKVRLFDSLTCYMIELIFYWIKFIIFKW